MADVTAETFINIRWRSVPSIVVVGRKVTYAIITDGKWGSENTPVLIASSLDADIAEHIVSVHNAAIQ